MKVLTVIRSTLGSNSIATVYLILLVASFAVGTAAKTYSVWATAGILCTFLLLGAVPFSVLLLAISIAERSERSTIESPAIRAPELQRKYTTLGPIVLLSVAALMLASVFLVGLFFNMP